MEKEKNKLDAGLASLDHYKTRLPQWRYNLREKLLPIVRWETPYVAFLQERMRTPALDSYFAMTANLGTHTAFMIVLPILFWSGYSDLGRGMMRTLAAGVFFSGVVKDLLCLPRPLSPPLTRITMSRSAALEYGFPSTHSTNAISVVVYSVLIMRYRSPEMDTNLGFYLQLSAYFYGFSIVLGRLYCGMHGFFDVVFGSLLGALLGFLEFFVGAKYDKWIVLGPFRYLFIAILIICVLVRMHPEPADNCPCYDDSVAFAAVWMGCDFGAWHFTQTEYSLSQPVPSTVPFDLEKLGWPTTIARVLVGVIAIFVWRTSMKSLLLRGLPPIFRVIETYGLTLPRRYFKPASEYTSVPKQGNDDNVIPRVRDIPGLLRRKRAISIGPQSEADAYEAIAYREKIRRDSITKGLLTPVIPPNGVTEQSSYFTTPGEPAASLSHGRKRSLSLEELRAQMGSPVGNLSPHAVESPLPPDFQKSVNTQPNDGLRDQGIFANIQKPRVRYDVEVITKLIVYGGIAWLAVEGNPILFHHLGLSL